MGSAFAPGRVIGRYRIDAKLGAGGMGAVFRAHDTLLRRDVAIKVLEDDLKARDPDESRARLLREARSAAALSHPNAVAVYDVGEHEGTAFIAMEVVHGKPLRAFLGDPAVPVEKKLKWLAGIADVLAAAHRAGLVHRDIKPDNVMVCADDSIKVLDFGIAKRTHVDEASTKDQSGAPASYRTQEGRVTGTPRYMAPEQKTGGKIDGRADQYAWGLVAFELLCGTHAQGDDVLPLLNASLDAGVPLLAIETIARALCGRAQDRFESMEEIVQRIMPVMVSSSPAASGTKTRDELPLGDTTADFTGDATDTVGGEAVPTRVEGSKATSRGRKSRILYAAAVGVAVALVGATFVVRPHLLGREGAPVTSASTASRSIVERVAILPLDAKGLDADHAYLGDELTGQIIGDLAAERAPQVIARASVLRYRDSNPSLADIAKELGVSVIVTGNVRIAGNDLVMSLEAVDATTQTTRWSHTYTAPLDDLTAIVHEASQGVRVALGFDGGVAASTKHAPKPAAYTSYLRGRFLFDQRTPVGLTKAISAYREAIAIDPAYADPWVGVADTFELERSVLSLPLAETEGPAEQALLQALAIDPTSSHAHASKGNFLDVFRWDYPGAEAEFKRALELDPQSVIAHQWYGGLLADRARFDDALAELERALALDPVNVPLLKSYGQVLYFAHQNSRAEQVLRRVLEMDDRQPVANLYLGLAIATRGDEVEALRCVDADVEFVPPPLRDSYRLIAEAMVESAAGQPALAAKKIRAVDSKFVLSAAPFLMSVAWAITGDTDKMLAALDKSITERALWTQLMNQLPVFDRYHGEPRFEALQRRAGFVQ